MAANFPIHKLTLDDSVDILQLTDDPSVVGYTANPGSLILQTTGQLWIKAGATDLEWEKFSAGAAAGRDQIVSTGLIQGGFITVNADPTKIDITAGIGLIVDNYTDILNPTGTLVTWDAFTEVTITNLATATRSFISIDIGGAVSQIPQPGLTNADHKDLIFLGQLGHANFSSIIAVRNNPDPGLDATARLADLARSIGTFNVKGNIYSPNGVNLNLNKSIGDTYKLGNNFAIDLKSPDTTSDPAETTVPFNYSYRDGSGGYTVETPAVTAVDSGFYDNGSGTLQAVPTNDWQIQVVKHFSGVSGVGSTRIEYGQATYATKAAALLAVPDPQHEDNPAFVDGVIRAYIVLADGATDLSSTAECEIIEASKFGGAGGSVSTSIATLQGTYDNSVDPEIVTSSPQGALTIKEGPVVGGNLLEGKDDADALVFAVAVDGTLPNTSVDNLNDMTLSTIVGNPSPAQDQTVLTTPDSVRVKDLSIETEVYQFSAAQVAPDAYLPVGAAIDPLTGIAVPLNGTIVRAVGHCSSTGGNTKGINVYLNADVSSTVTLGTFSGAGEQTFANNTLNTDVAAGDKIRLRGSSAVGTIEDTIITLYIKWRA